MEKNSSEQFQRFVDCLIEQRDVYLRVLEVLESERKFLVIADIPALVDNNRLKEALLGKSRALEKIRQVRLEEFLRFLNQEIQDRSVSDLIPLLNKDEARKLIEIQGSLSELVQKLKTSNLQNEKLVSSAKSVIDAGLKAFKGETPTNQVYKKQGKLDQGRAPGKLVSKEI